VDGSDSNLLSGRQERFCELYVTGKSATAAYREAYGNKKTARAAASRLLTNVNVQKRIAALQEASASAAVMTLRKMPEYLCRVVRTPIGEVSPQSDLCQSYACRGVRMDGEKVRKTSVSISMPDKIRAMELDVKLTGGFKKPEAPDDWLTKLLAEIRAGK